MRYKITLSYNGSDFCGWQSQRGVATVQETLEKALSLLLGTEIAVIGAGRTDSKVNAVGYVASFDFPAPSGPVPPTLERSETDIETRQIRYKLNAILPRSIVVHSIVPAAPDFHARFDARAREYTYFLHRRKDPFMEGRSLFYSFPLDVSAMNEAAAGLLGTRDFAAFQKIGGDNKTSVCTVTEAKWIIYKPDHVRLMGYKAAEGDYMYFRIRADRFLRNMVRAAVGTLLEIGRGKREPRWIEEVLASGSRSSAGESVPGYPLFLSKVEYGDSE